MSEGVPEVSRVLKHPDRRGHTVIRPRASFSPGRAPLRRACCRAESSGFPTLCSFSKEPHSPQGLQRHLSVPHTLPRMSVWHRMSPPRQVFHMPLGRLGHLFTPLQHPMSPGMCNVTVVHILSRLPSPDCDPLWAWRGVYPRGTPSCHHGARHQHTGEALQKLLANK